MTTLTHSVHGIKDVKGLNIVLWIAQIFLIGVFAMTGVMKAFMPIADIARNFAWVEDVSVVMVRFIGVCEIAGALGLILPPMFKFLPGYLTPLAGLGLMTIMILAIGFHTMRGEMQVLPINVLLGSIALFVAWGRYRKYPVHPHT